jgi:DNA polymerase III delta prime subunit
MSFENLNVVAEEVLSTFSKIESIASTKLSSMGKASPDAFANPNTFNGNAVENLVRINQENADGYESLIKEPAVTRLLVKDDSGNQSVIYIARKSSIPLSSDIKLASYRSPVGALASLPVGDELTVKVGDNRINYYLVEKVSLHPRKQTSEWDSEDNVFNHHELESQTVTSFRLLLNPHVHDYSDELDALLSQAESADIVINGIRHKVRAAMSLRDQPILDKFQDEIFRLPIDSQLIILGPPGTGKTTTLIKRLGQKLDVANAIHLDESESRILNEPGHSASWLMFTPSELLKHYLKEAFSRESVPASDERIKTWTNYRAVLARNTFGILRSANGGRYTLKSDINIVSDSAVNEPSGWFNAFKNHHWSKLIEQLMQGKEQVEKSSTIQNDTVLAKLKNLLVTPDKISPVGLLQQLDALEKEIKSALESAKAIADKLVTEQRNLLYNRDKTVFDSMAVFLDSITVSDDEDEDAEFDEEVDTQVVAPSRSAVQKVVSAYIGFIKSYSRQLYLGRSLPKDSKSAKIRDWLGESRLPNREILLSIGQQITYQNGLRRFLNMPKRYAFGVVNSYADFRKLNLENNGWYLASNFNSANVDGNEVDAMLLLIFQNARELLAQNFVSRNLELAKFAGLNDFYGKLKNQIMVDEATDFSVLQLACMRMLTSLKTNSFFACGDFNQRITRQGVTKLGLLNWIIPNLESKRVNTVYRQSKLLNAFARSLIEITGGDKETLGELPKGSMHDGVYPILLEHAQDSGLVAEWIASQIRVIERNLEILPTIAVLVNDETEVKPMTESLNQYLEDMSLKAVACEEGKSLGEGTDIRVFDIQHIKGLEFEAVFFAGVDKLAANKPELFDRFIYVGATRAATYLGMVCYDSLPAKLEPIRALCSDKW